MDTKGFVKLYRSLIYAWRNSLSNEEIGILVQLMCMVNYDSKPVKAPKGDLLQRGQMVISYRSFAKNFNLSKGKTERMLEKFKYLGLITMETSFKTPSGKPTGTVLTLNFYESSQGSADNIRDRNRDKNGDAIRNKNNKNASPAQDPVGPEREQITEKDDQPGYHGTKHIAGIKYTVS